MIYRFCEVELDEAARELRRSGTVIRPEPKIFDALVLLVQNRARVVTKEELLAMVWEGQAMGDAVLARAVHEVRKLIGDNGAIKTFYGRGYRLVVPVTECSRVPEHSARAEPSDSEVRRLEVSGLREDSFIGREEELALASSCVNAAVAGQTRVFAITGEAGIGKTTVSNRVLGLARSRGMTCVVGRCSEVPGAPAYWPWIQIVRDMKATLPGRMEGLLEENEELRALISMSGIEPGGTAQTGEQARFRLFDTLRYSFESVAEEDPLTVIIDDLHRADTPSLLLFQFLVEHLTRARLLVVTAFRDAEMRADPGRARWMSNVVRQTGVRFVPLSGFDRVQIGQFVEAATGVVPDGFALDYLAEQTAGNPFYLSQLVPLLAEHEKLDPSRSAKWQAGTALSRGVRTAIIGHLSALPDHTRRALQVAAVIGRDFQVPVVAKALAVSPVELLTMIQPALDARLIASVDGLETAFRFAHVLIRDALFDELPKPDRAMLHASVGHALEDMAGSAASAVATELAHHFARAASLVGPEKAVHYASLAGDLALRLFAYEDAARQFDAARTLLEQYSVSDDSRRCEIFLKLGVAQVRSGYLDAARSTFQRAADLARRIRAPERLAAVALDLAPGFLSIETGILDEYLVERLEKALTALEDRDAALRARLLGRLAMALYWTDQEERRRELCDQADVEAAKSGRKDARLHALYSRHSALWSAHNLNDRLLLSEDLTRLAEATNDRDALLVTRCFRITNFLEAGDIAAVRGEVDRFGKLAHSSKQPECTWMSDMYHAMLALLRGDFAKVEQFGGQSVALGNRIKHHNAVQTGGAYILFARAETAGVDEVLPMLEAYVEAYPATHGWLPLYAFGCVRAGDLRRAQQVLPRAISLELGAPRDTLWLISLAWLSEVIHALGASSEAAAIYELLLPHAAQHAVLGYGVATFGSVERYLGLLSLVRSDAAAAVDHLERALVRNGELDAPALVAHTEFDLARALRVRRGSSDGGRGDGLVLRASETAAELGMRWLGRRVGEWRAAG